MFYGDQLVYLLVCLVGSKTMALKNFFFRENWVGIEVAGMLIAFLPFLIQHGPTFWPSKGQNMEFFKQYFNLKSLRKSLIITKYLT